MCILIKTSKEDYKHYLLDFTNGKANLLNQCSSFIMMRTVESKNERCFKFCYNNNLHFPKLLKILK